ncbi:spore germination protein [Leptolyngbya sp. NK1-12]|uniref:Spore germination protein n=1 Tax=Leptolyngbya sp. NK1-12 TaxID=2547451 RepID=A0AA96WFG7_9CYAN|nr:spore germination protein [Leptolyngbya sp. NK1-12]
MRDHDPASPQPTSRRSVPRGVIAGLAAVVLATAAGTAWWTWRSFQAQQQPQPLPTTAPQPTQSPDISQAPIQQTVQVYWLRSLDDRFELVPVPVAVTAPGQPDALVKAALEAMLQGTPESEFTSTVPQGTQLRQVEIKPDGIHVDLSPEFTGGGGSASMTGRLGQVLYTATTLDPNAPVWISVEGKPLEVLGGEGLMIDQPMTRQSFEQNFPL